MAVRAYVPKFGAYSRYRAIGLKLVCSKTINLSPTSNCEGRPLRLTTNMQSARSFITLARTVAARRVAVSAAPALQVRIFASASELC